ncbi:MAG: hypothetical protein R3Y38_01660 [Rikenellaceae bacterium]
MKLYILRAVKYFISLIILLGLIFALMFLSGQNANGQLIHTLTSSKGLLLALAIIALSATYPYFGYTVRAIRCRVKEETITKVFELCGYELKARGEDGELTFRAQSIIKRAKTLGEDKITLKLEDKQMIISGIRKETVRIEYRLRTFLKNNEN